MPKVWRLLYSNSTDPKMNLATNEAIFTSRYEDLAKETLHLWSSSKSVIFSASREDIDIENCKRLGIELVRAFSVNPTVLYQDRGSLNFAVVANTSAFAEKNNPVLSSYQVLNEAVAKGLEKFDVKLRVSPSGVYANNKKIVENLPVWLNNHLLFQGTLYVDTDLEILRWVIKPNTFSQKEEAMGTLSQEAGQKISIDTVKEVILSGIKRRLNIEFEEEGLTTDEQKLVDKLFRMKYNSERWNVDGNEPILVDMGKIAIEVFVAYPPTSKCRKLIQLVNEATADLQDKGKVLIWMKGRGLDQHRSYPHSPALFEAAKRSVIPTVIINGKMDFKDVPSKDDLRKAIISAL